ncbi:hypothetical protein BpHYR1_001120 [Brachionus plicatilis]|uniref:Uncharacterized protein n=1 Tax=Brachionus plicatilis TaxID=10195 RepID=A0A3M7P1Y8_BRAPC|nr:hypothetical protein BpHYR1_001120 [Brachionus plicatilis]
MILKMPLYHIFYRKLGTDQRDQPKTIIFSRKFRPYIIKRLNFQQNSKSKKALNLNM